MQAIEAWGLLKSIDPDSREAQQGLEWCHVSLARAAERNSDEAAARRHWNALLELVPRRPARARRSGPAGRNGCLRHFGRRDMSEDDKTKPFTGEIATEAKQKAAVKKAQKSQGSAKKPPSGEKPKRKTSTKARRPADKTASVPDASAEETAQEKLPSRKPGSTLPRHAGRRGREGRTQSGQAESQGRCEGGSPKPQGRGSEGCPRSGSGGGASRAQGCKAKSQEAENRSARAPGRKRSPRMKPPRRRAGRPSLRPRPRAGPARRQFNRKRPR